MENTKKRILIVGASSLIAEHCARLWSQKHSTELILIARNLEKIEKIAKDLQVRNQDTNIQIYQINFLDTQQIQTVIEDIFKEKPIDIALIAQGNLPHQEICQNDLTKNKAAIEINAISPVLFAEEIIKHMYKSNSGKLGIIGSVAGDRGRKSNYIYGASKGFIERYAQGIQHRLAIEQSNIRVTLIKPGPTQTPMTQDLNTKGKLATPDQVAQDIVKAIEGNKLKVYSPSKWALIMWVIRHLPFFIFKKMDI